MLRGRVKMELIIVALVGYIIFRIYATSRGKRDIMQAHAYKLMAESFRMMEDKRAKIEAQGIPYIHHNPSEGIFQMVSFPYKTYEEWDAAYKKSAVEANPSLKIKGTDMSLIDCLDDELRRRAYAHHLHPERMGRKHGEIFDPLNIRF